MDGPLRVLEVISEANRGGAETWLLHALRQVNRNQVAIDFLVYDEGQGAYEKEFRDTGAKVFVCKGHRNLLRHFRNLRALIRRHGPYEIVHTHTDYFGGLVLLYAWLLGVRIRIAHSHNDTSVVDSTAGLTRRLYIRLMKLLVGTFSTGGLGTSEASAALMFGKDWRSDRRWRVIPSCVDLSAFLTHPDRRQVRAELGIPDNAVVFGHVGRFVKQKNHEFLLRVAERLVFQDDRITFLLVGGGSDQKHIEDSVRARGLADRVIILSPRGDVPRLMLGAMDFFIFPSRHEGLGLALVEAQAAGLRCFVSATVPPEAIVVPSLVQRLSLSAGAEHWANSILEQTSTPSSVCRKEALRTVLSSFDIRRNAAQLVDFYLALASR